MIGKRDLIAKRPNLPTLCGGRTGATSTATLEDIMLKRQKSKVKRRNPVKRSMDIVSSPKVFKSRRNKLLAKSADQEIRDYFNRENEV